MSKTICIFSDGTGQAGGSNPINWTSVYRLYVNARDVDPGQQVCFYDPGIGSDPDQQEERSFTLGFRQWLAKAVGAGITRNIVDCYTALLLTYEPGDRVFLFGFSRGAYTARSVAGAMGLCGVPPNLRKVDGRNPTQISDRLNDPTIRPIAEEAVRHVYMTYGDVDLRQARAAEFRAKYNTKTLPPFFIGVWDTVRALGWQVTNIADFGRHRFHDSKLNHAVDHGRQALSIDDNRKVFAPELWDERGAPAGQIKQIWLAGDHSDIGGGYGLKMGLTDLSMKWMVDEAVAARDRVAHPERNGHFPGFQVDPQLLAELNLEQLGVQHDPRRSLWGKVWWPASRAPFVSAPELAGPAKTQRSLHARFRAPSVPVDDLMQVYRPNSMRAHPDYASYYLTS